MNTMMTRAESEAIRLLASAGKTPREIAATLGRTESGIRRHLRRAPKPTKVSLVLELRDKTHAALARAAERRHVLVEELAAALIDGVVRHGSIDRTLSGFDARSEAFGQVAADRPRSYPLGDVRRDPPRLILAEQLGGRSPGREGQTEQQKRARR